MDLRFNEYSEENIWKSMNVVNLKKNHRQGISIWTDCLNRMSVRELSEEDKALLAVSRLQQRPNVDIDKIGIVTR